MAQYISKSALVAEIEKYIDIYKGGDKYDTYVENVLITLKRKINSLEVKDPYEQLIQYSSIEDGIKAHAEDYSWNIESELFQQLTPEQQKLWRNEIEQACISGGYNGLDLAKDPRYKENFEVKELDLVKELNGFQNFYAHENSGEFPSAIEIAKHFFELGLKAQKGERV